MSALEPLFESLRKAQAELALQNRGQKDAALRAVMEAIGNGRGEILAANAADVEKARGSGMTEALVDRLLLNDARIDDIIEGIDTVARQ